MTTHRQKIDVSFEYPVIFTRDVFSPENPDFLKALAAESPDRPRRFLAVIDWGVADAWPDLSQKIAAYATFHRRSLEMAGEPLIVAGGEIAKTDGRLLDAVLKRLYDEHLDRQSCVAVIGGGAVQDMAGYAAALVHRGLRIIRLPTTVLSQNDSGVGVKNGVNAFGVKNFLGTFWPPHAVINDFDFIETLHERDRIAGMAEAVKVALIRDHDFFAWLESNAKSLRAFEPKAMEDMILRGALLHLKHIATSGDPFEFGSARPLDFGHWAAHKLESMTDYRLRHGEAVAIGMALDCCYSKEIGLLDETSLARILRLMESLGFCLWDDALVRRKGDRLEVLGGLADFREHLGGDLTVTLLSAVGHGIDAHEIETDVVARCIELLQMRVAA